MKQTLLIAVIGLALMGAVGCTGINKSIEVGNPLETEAPEPELSYTNDHFGVAMKVRADFTLAEQTDVQWMFVKAPSIMRVDFAWDEGNCVVEETSRREEGFIYAKDVKSVPSAQNARPVCVGIDAKIAEGELESEEALPIQIDTAEEEEGAVQEETSAAASEELSEGEGDKLVSIPDQMLYVRLRKALGLSDDVVITHAQAVTLTELDAGRSNDDGSCKTTGTKIVSLEGLSAFRALRVLDLSCNAIVDIGELAALGELATLNLSSNVIRAIDALSGLPKLRVLLLSNNILEDVAALASLPQLERLSLSNTPFLDAGMAGAEPLKALVHLTALHLADAGVTDLAFLRGMTKLSSLDLEANGIVDLAGLSGLSQLSLLNLAGNQIVDLEPLRPLTALKQLGLNDNSGVKRIDVLWDMRDPGGAFTPNGSIDLQNMSGLLESGDVILRAKNAVGKLIAAGVAVQADAELMP